MNPCRAKYEGRTCERLVGHPGPHEAYLPMGCILNWTETPMKKEFEYTVDETARGFGATVVNDLREDFAGKRVRVTIEELPPEKCLGRVAQETAVTRGISGALWSNLHEEVRLDWGAIADEVVAEAKKRGLL